jgi:hypothetical protein
MLVEWAKKRPGPELWSPRIMLGFVTTWPVPFEHGSSTMVAAQYALQVWGFKRVVLVGVPLDGSYVGYLPGWQAMKGNYASQIRSMSGNTLKLFGRPDAAFVQG